MDERWYKNRRTGKNSEFSKQSADEKIRQKKLKWLKASKEKYPEEPEEVAYDSVS